MMRLNICLLHTELKCVRITMGLAEADRVNLIRVIYESTMFDCFTFLSVISVLLIMICFSSTKPTKVHVAYVCRTLPSEVRISKQAFMIQPSTEISSNRSIKIVSDCLPVWSVVLQLICNRDIMAFPRNCNSKSQQR